MTLETMAERLQANRGAFAAVHDREKPSDSQDFKTIAALRARKPGESEEERNRADILEALKRAKDEDWLDRFTPAVLSELTDDAQLVIELQAITNPKVDFDHVGDVSTGLLKAMRRCCRIVCGDDGDASRGSGFLIGPQLVLTNWHVVSRKILADEAVEKRWLADQDALRAAGKAAEADGLPRPARPPIAIRVEFDLVRNRDGTINEPRKELVIDAWLVASSRDSSEAAPAGLVRPLPNNLDVLKTCLDFAVLELANPVGYERGWYVLDKDLAPPQPDAQGVLVQFPGEYAMRVTAGAFTEGEPELPARVRHAMNTIGGSSGGLCATTTYEPLALHQGSLKTKRQQDAVEKKRLDMGVENVAIPLGLIAEAAGQTIALRAREAPALIHRTTAGEPIVGRSALQRALHESIYGDNRIIVVRNNFDSNTGKLRAGIGKSFTVKILEAMTRPDETLIRTISAKELPADPYAAARALAAPFREAAGDAGAQAFAAVETAAPHGDTTQDADARGLADSLANALRLAAGTRTLWLVIDDLDRHPVDGAGQTANLLNLLYEQITADQRLRALLIGPSPSFLPAPTLKLRNDGPLGEIEPAEIEQWIALARGPDRPFDNNNISMLQRMAIAMLPGWKPEQMMSRSARLAQILTDVIGPQL